MRFLMTARKDTDVLARFDALLQEASPDEERQMLTRLLRQTESGRKVARQGMRQMPPHMVESLRQ